MAYFSSIQNFIDTVTARFNKPKRSLVNDGLVKQDIIDALTDAAKYADDVKVAGEALNANFIARSLNLSATIYVDGVNGNDARTGTTNDNNAATGCVKTLARVAALHSQKTSSLTINIVNVVNISANVFFDIQNVSINILPGGILRFKKFTAAAGDGTNKIELRSANCSIYINPGGTLEVEAHAGSTNVGDQFFYRNYQGAIALVAVNGECIYSGDIQSLSVRNGGSFIIGDNTTFCVAGQNGTNRYGSVNARYRFGYGFAPTLGANAVESDLIGDRLFPRAYTPTSSTDIKVMEGEMVADNNYLFRKNGGVIKKIAWTAY